MDNINNSSKKGAIIKIICYSVVAAILLGVLVIAMLGSSRNSVFSLGTSSFIYSDSKSYNIGNIEYTESFSDMEINWAAGSLEILPYEGTAVKIEESGEYEERDKIRTRVIGNKLTVQYVESGLRMFEKIPEKVLKIYLPTERSMQLGNIKINTASASTIVNDTVIGVLSYNGASGTLKLCNVDISMLDINTASGAVDISGKLGRLDVDTASGNIALNGDASAVEIDAASADISLSGKYGDTDIDAASSRITITGVCSNAEINTASGDITLNIPTGTVGVNVELDSASGQMTINKNGVTYHAKAFADGVPIYIYEIDTASGDVYVNIG